MGNRPALPVEDWEEQISNYGIIDSSKPVYVRSCDSCRELFRTNQQNGYECEQCEEDRWAQEMDRYDDYEPYDPNWEDDDEFAYIEHDNDYKYPFWEHCWSFCEEWQWELWDTEFFHPLRESSMRGRM